jgi:threonine dehydrogenase-like Zn-dependent dehydrogenase
MADWELIAAGHGVRFRDLPSPGPLPEGHFDVRTRYSGISTGTELGILKGTNPMLRRRWDSDFGLFGPDQAVAEPRLGYMQAGKVADSRAPAVPVGSTVAMTYGHRGAYRADPSADRFVFVPPDLDPLLGIFVAHMGPICANGLLHAAAEHHTKVDSLARGVRGRRIAITGCGVVALLTALFVRRHGAESVVLVDSAPARRAVAENLGFDTLDQADAAVILKTRWRHGPGDRGADVVFQCRGVSASLALALRLLRPQGTVIDLAFYQEGAPELRLGEEFHHNGLSIRCAQIGRVPQGSGWDRARLSAETISLLHEEGPVIAKHLITDVVPAREAPQLFDDLLHRRRTIMQAVVRG